MKNLFMKWILIVGILYFNLISFAQQDASGLSHLHHAIFSEMLTFAEQNSSFSDLTDAQIRKERVFPVSVLDS